MKCRQVILLLIAAGMMGGLAGCMGPASLTITSPPVSILFVDALPTSLAVNAATPVSAAVSNTSILQVNWSVTCGSAGACGSFLYSSSASGALNTYTAPSAIPSGGTVTVTATAAADPTKSVSATITITAPVPIVVSFQGVPPASLQINATAAISAKIANDVSSNPQVQWTVSCAGAACGSFNPVTTTNEAPTNYTAPSSIPSGNTVTVTTTSVTDPTKSASASITITKAAPTLANGTYVFQLAGPVGSGPNFMTGVFTAQNGAIIGGEQDSIESDDQYLAQFDPISGGSYATTPDGNLQITLKSNYFYFNSEQTETLNGVIISGSRVLVEEFNGYPANGTLDLQTSTAPPSGGYAFSMAGVDAAGEAAGIGGVLNVDSAGGISGAGSVLDFNDAGTFVGAQALGASTVSNPDSFGRVVFQIVPRTSLSFPSLNLAGYIVDATHLRLVETSGDNFQGAVGGTALAQGANTGSFSASSITGSSYVFAADRWPTNDTGPLQVAGVFTAKADGSLTGTLNWNNLSGTEAQSPIPFTGSYTVDSTGRATLSNLTDGATFKYQLQLYLNGNGQGLVLSSDPAEMIAGRGFQQQAGPFSAASFSGSYGLNAAQFGTYQFGPLETATALGPVTVAVDNGSNTVAGFVDFGYGAADYAVSGSFSAGQNGVFTGTFTGLNSASVTWADNFVLYFVDNTRAVMIETDNTQLTLGYLGLQQ
jgi:hypothetical protein